jgi:hypothetical protein
MFFGFFENPGTYNLKREYLLFHDQKRIPNEMLPIAVDDGGNLYLLSLRSKDYSTIYFWDHELEGDEGEEPTEENLTYLSHSFSNFFSNLKKLKFSEKPQVISVWVKPGTEDLFKQYEK